MTIRQIPIAEAACRLLLQELNGSRAARAYYCRDCGIKHNDAVVALCDRCKAKPVTVQHISINALDPLDPVHARDDAAFDRARDVEERRLSEQDAYAEERPIQSGRFR